MKLREREGQNVDLERSLKGPLLIVDGRYWIVDTLSLGSLQVIADWSL